MTESEGRDRTPPRATTRIARASSARLRPLASADAEPPPKPIDDEAARQELGNLGGVISYFLDEVDALARKNLIDTVKVTAFNRWRGIADSAQTLLVAYISARMEQGLDWAEKLSAAGRSAAAHQRLAEEYKVRLDEALHNNQLHVDFASWAEPEIERLTSERDAWMQEREALLQEREALIRERESFLDEVNALKDAVAAASQASQPAEDTDLLHEELTVLQQERDKLAEQLAERDEDVARLRSENAMSRRATMRLQSLSDSRVPAEDLARVQSELDRHKIENERLKAALAEQQSTMLGQKAKLEAESAARGKAEIERDSLRDQVKRTGTEAMRAIQDAEAAQRRAEEARREAERQKELAEHARTEVAALKETTRVTKSGVPLLILVSMTKEEVATHKNKSPEQLLKLFPAPNLGNFLVRVAEAAVDHLAKGGSFADFRSALGNIRQNVLDEYFDDEAPLPDAMRKGVEESRVWFNRLHQHLALTTTHTVTLQSKLAVMREERDGVQRELDRALRDNEALWREISTTQEGLKTIIRLPAIALNGNGVG